MGIRSQNNPAASYLDKWLATGTEAMDPPGTDAVVATGGVVNEYTDPGGVVYRSHSFEASGTFEITEAPASLELDWLCIGGGGAGGYHQAGGGGAGGYRTSMPEGPGGPSPTAEAKISTPGTFPAPWTITVGAGGIRQTSDNPSAHGDGAGGGVSSISPTIVSQGGGGGTSYYHWWDGGDASNSKGASGGGGAGYGSGVGAPGGEGNFDANGSTPVPNQGYDGGGGGSAAHRAGGGGGAGGLGGDRSLPAPAPSYAGPGGIGKTSAIRFGPASTVNYAGGGGGSCEIDDSSMVGGSPANPGGVGGVPYGGGLGGYSVSCPVDIDGAQGKGGGGGGAAVHGTAPGSGQGGSGFVCIRYVIGAGSTKTAKASGGNISFTPTHTVHVYESSGTFVVPAPQAPDPAFAGNAEVFLVAGGGAGSGARETVAGAGGGGGAVEYHQSQTFVAGTCPITVGAGGGCIGLAINPNSGSNSVVNNPQAVHTATGGGGGAQYNPLTPQPSNGHPGGSSGGGAFASGSAGTASGSPWPGSADAVSTGAGFGYDGGPANGPGNHQGGGGGGGAGGPGDEAGDSNGGPGGNGGAGATYTLKNTGSTLTFGAGGGGGGGMAPGSGTYPGGEGGSSIAGDGGTGHPAPYAQGSGPLSPTNEPGVGKNAVVNTGSGGGGGAGTVSPYYIMSGGNGSSGIVIIRYPT